MHHGRPQGPRCRLLQALAGRGPAPDRFGVDRLEEATPARDLVGQTGGILRQPEPARLDAVEGSQGSRRMAQTRAHLLGFDRLALEVEEGLDRRSPRRAETSRRAAAPPGGAPTSSHSHLRHGHVAGPCERPHEPGLAPRHRECRTGSSPGGATLDHDFCGRAACAVGGRLGAPPDNCSTPP